MTTTYAATFALTASLTISVALTTLQQTNMLGNTIVSPQAKIYTNRSSAVVTPEVTAICNVQHMVGVGLLSFNRTYGEYPKRLVQTFGAGMVSSILGIVFGIIYFVSTTYVFALIGSLLFAFGACAIAATLLLGEDIKQTHAP